VTPHSSPRSQAGFSLPELLIAVTVLLIISSAVTSALLQMTSSQRTIWNRTQLHAGVRSATELLQQEVGQAGKISLPGVVTLAAAIPSGVQTVAVRVDGAVPATMSGFFVGEQLVIDVGGPNPCVEAVTPCQETVKVTAVDAAAKQITGTFVYPHLANTPVNVLGGFGTGIVPPLAGGFPNGSTPSVLKLFGDINGDGTLVYVEYTCDPVGGPGPGTGNLYRNVMPYDQAPPKAPPTAGQVLLANIQTNPGGTACFTYMPNPLPIVTGNSYVLDVAITLTVNTQVIDPLTRQFQTETKALLNVSPRNVFNVWQLASAGVAERIQPMPPTVVALLP
jgi:prepilin-type N-terminal cleavage/methylation domain-containing protein